MAENYPEKSPVNQGEPSPLRLTGIIAGTIFVTEFLIMVFLPSQSSVAFGVLDALLLVTVLLPSLYYFVYLPFSNSLMSLRAVSATLEHQVLEKTAAEERTRSVLEELKKANQELEEFNSIASHDLQEPLRTLVSYANLLKEDIGPGITPHASKDIAFIAEAATRMRGQVQALLELSRAGRVEFKMEPVDLNVVIDMVVRDLEARIKETGGVVEWERLPVVMGDTSQLFRVFLNLIDNALKFRGENPPLVKASAVKDNGTYIISITDNGIGMDPQYLDQIFIPFRRLHGRSKYPGSGIGLSICRKIIHRHNGKCGVVSSLGQGSTFTFTLRDAMSK